MGEETVIFTGKAFTNKIELSTIKLWIHLKEMAQEASKVLRALSHSIRSLTIRETDSDGLIKINNVVVISPSILWRGDFILISSSLSSFNLERSTLQEKPVHAIGSWSTIQPEQ